MANTLCVAQEFCEIKNGYAHFVGNKKAKGVDFKIRIPESCTIEDGKTPNVVANIKNAYMSFYMMIHNNYTFISRGQAKEAYATDNLIKEYLIQPWAESGHNLQIIASDECVIDSYPAIKIICTDTSSHALIVFYLLLFEDYFIQINGYVFKDFLEYLHPESIPSSLIEHALVTIDSIAHSLVLFDHYK